MSGDNIGFVDEQQGKDALFDVRSDSTDTDWCLFSYENPKSNKIVLVGKGNGGANQLVENLKDDMVGYGFVRKSDKIDDSVTVKFALITWMGESVPRMQKARMSVHSGSVKTFVGQSHVFISASHLSEISDEILNQKIMDASGSGSKVVDKATGAKERRESVVTKSSSNSGNSGKSGSVEFANREELKDAISDVRKGNADWMLMSYSGGNTNTVVLVGKGSGGADEILAHLTDEMVGYAIIRKTEKIDVTEAIKFAYIRFVGDNVPRMLKARLGTHSGSIIELIAPYHVSLDVTSKSEISDEIIMKTIQSASGTRVNVVESENRIPTSTGVFTGQRAAPKATSTNSTKTPAAPKLQDGSVVKFVDKDSLLQDIKDVKHGVTEWCLIGYEGKKGNTLVTIGKGNGGVEELAELVEEDMTAYALIRKTDKIDQSLTVKFAFITWMGENTDRMHKARLGTHKGAVTDLFAPYSVDLNTSSKSDLTDDNILRLIQENSGTRSKVKN